MKQLFIKAFKALYPDSVLTDFLALMSIVALGYFGILAEWVMK